MPWQRSVLFLDVLRQRGNQYLEHMAMQAPKRPAVPGRAGRRPTLPRPVNYAGADHPATGVIVDQRKRPFVVDPRAGHGPGIGGFKADSEIGVAMRAGHPCYFVGFLPERGARADDRGHHGGRGRLPRARDPLHPDADGKPVVIGNCARPAGR